MNNPIVTSLNTDLSYPPDVGSYIKAYEFAWLNQHVADSINNHNDPTQVRSRYLCLNSVVDVETLCPENFFVVGSHYTPPSDFSSEDDLTTGYKATCFINEDRSTLVVAIFHSRQKRIYIHLSTTNGESELDSLATNIVALCTPVPPPSTGKTYVTFWTNSSGGGSNSYVREIDSPQWKNVADNYPKDVRPSLEALTSWNSPPPSAGGLLLFHGPPGTGKTSFIKVLTESWKNWCHFSYVIDPDQLFLDSSYLMDVLTRNTKINNCDNPWKLLIVEDADELISSDAKNKSGQQMSRLLNVTDGFVGQGLNVLFLITTNEALPNLNQAAIRPGRCLANVELGAFSAQHADDWRESHDLPRKNEIATLAELYQEYRNSFQVIAKAPELSTGAGYL